MSLDKLGRYDIVGVLGKGSMGVVYEARDPFLDRRVAIKTIRGLSPTSDAAAEYERRFRTEARSAARLHHPHIVSVFDSGRDGDTAYLVMEFVQGDDLKHHLERGVRFSPQSAVKLVLDLLTALEHAHGQNVVHRDIKPANILIEASGQIKLADFGVARIQDTDEGTLTQVGGASLGTPKYMSPEQAQGLPVDLRSDLFSVGVVLYELLTGVRPFDGDNQFIVVNQIVTAAPAAPSAVEPDLTSELDPVLLKALAKLPQDRYQSAREFALALQAVVQSLATVSDHAAAPRWEGAGSTPPASAGSGMSPLLFGSSGRSTGSLSGSSSGLQTFAIGQELELEYWKDIKDSGEVQDFTAFLARFPAGVYAERARRRLERFAKTGPVEPSAGGPAHEARAAHAATTAPAQLEARQGATAAAPERYEQALVQRRRWGLAVTAVLATVLLGGTAVWLRWPDDASQNADLQPRMVTPQGAAAPAIVPARLPGVPAGPVAPAMAGKPDATLHRSAGSPQAGASSAGVPKSPAVKPATLTIAASRLPASGAVAVLGPSSAGEACGDRSFLFRIPCVAQQCAQDRYRLSQECVDFRELEQRREQNRRAP